MWYKGNVAVLIIKFFLFCIIYFNNIKVNDKKILFGVLLNIYNCMIISIKSDMTRIDSTDNKL